MNTRKIRAYLASLVVLVAGQVGASNTTTDLKKNSVTASQINADTVDQLQRQGPDAIGGLNDWFISNGTVCAVISDVAHEGEFSTRGGSLVDLGFCGRADDYFAFTHDLIDGSRRRPLDAETVHIEPFNGAPSIVVHSSGDGAKLTTRYYFDPKQRHQLKISKRYTKSEGESFNLVSPLNFNLRSLEPFVFNSRAPELSNGFQNEDFVQRGIGAIGSAARHADTLILSSPRNAPVGISYGWQLTNAQRVNANKRVDVPFFILADTESTAMMILTDTFYLGDGRKIGWLQLPQIPLLELDNAALETQETIYIGQRGDVASITDQLITDGVSVKGTINDTNSALHVFYENGTPLTHIKPDQHGTFEFTVPEGNYTLTAMAYGNRRLSMPLNVNIAKLDTQERITLEPITLPPAISIELPQGEAMRLVFVGINGTPDPDFAGELTGASVKFDDHIERKPPMSSVFLAGVGSDPKHIIIAPGNYRVYATKGPEYSLTTTTLQIEDALQLSDSKVVTLEIERPKRAILTPNFIASDLHVHSGLSFDNAFAEAERVRTFAAEHGEVMVSSEHDLPTDYAPHIKEVGVEDKIVSIPAAEMTSLLPNKLNPYTGGHANIFPFEPKHTHYRNGMFNHEGTRLRDVIHRTKQANPNALVQLNHPRTNLALSGETLPDGWQELVDYGHYFDHMGPAGHPYNPNQALHTHPNNSLIEPDPVTGIRDVDFDLIEVMNPGRDNHESRLKAVRQDWLSLLKQGERVVATANSDSHNAYEQVGMPRTMVAMNNDTVVNFDQANFVAHLKAGQAYGTTGPMLDIALLDTKMGGTFSGVRGTLSVNVTRADWIKVDRLEIQINGHTIDTHALKNITEQTIKVPLEFERDSFVTVEVFGPITDDYATIYPHISPYAFSNPIYVDADQDGEWQAPGLVSFDKQSKK